MTGPQRLPADLTTLRDVQVYADEHGLGFWELIRQRATKADLLLLAAASDLPPASLLRDAEANGWRPARQQPEK